MKKNFLFMSVMASLFMVGCSQEEFTPDGGDNGNGEFNTSYMAVNLMSSDVTKGTRAADGYEDGDDTENKVSKVRFYFFTENDAIANVKLQGNTYVNYYDWTPKIGEQTTPDPDDTDDVESTLAATIVINTKNGDELPKKIAAVLNPTNDLGNTSKNLSELKAITADYAASTLTAEGKFVMFNSVYGKDNAEFCAVPIEVKHLCKSETDAKATPVTIYVERSVAKVKVLLGDNVASAGTDKLLLKDKDGNDLKVGDKQVYLKLNNWGLTAETDKGRLVKGISPAWSYDWWNGQHRSFWAINAADATNVYGNYMDISTGFNPADPSELYTNENAEDYTTGGKAPLKRTKVILKGTLCDENGDAFTIVRHLGSHFADTYSATETENLLQLKKSILAQLEAANLYYYYQDGNERKQIAAEDLKIVVATQQTTEGSDNNCYVYAQLTDAAALKTWYTSKDESTTPLEDAADVINGKLKDESVVEQALVWRSGMTYYYYEIIHNGTGVNATKGVVRNHIYQTKVTKIAGLGTPVYDPDQTIYPEKPSEEDYYIAAEINILSWRLVENDYPLEW